MFGRLVKYDFRSMFKQFGFIWPAALLLALVNHFTLFGLNSTSTVGETTAGMAMLVYVAILMAMFIITMILVIQRFFKGLLGDEGYLMHTLPVRPWQLISSKLLSAVAATLLSIVVAVFSILLIAPVQWVPELGTLFRGLGYLFTHWNIHATHGVFFLLELLLLICVGMAQGYLQLYLAMAVGHLFSRNRVAMSVAAYIAINTVMGTLLGVLGSINFRPLRAALDVLSGMEGMAGAHVALWIAIVWTGLLSALYFFCTEYILRRRLNLE